MTTIRTCLSQQTPANWSLYWTASAAGRNTRQAVPAQHIRCMTTWPGAKDHITSIQRFRDDSTGETHWRTLSRDNVTSVYGSTLQSRISDPADPSRVFAWLLDFSYDSSGNVITYEYVAENGAGIQPSAGEQGRQVTANRYLKRVKYGFVTPYAAATGGALPADWRFQLLFDYGEHCTQSPGPHAEAEWPARLDPFSSYRAGFEVRTYRLCRRVLHFCREAWTTAKSLPALKLLGATNLEYTQGPAASFLRSVTRNSSASSLRLQRNGCGQRHPLLSVWASWQVDGLVPSK